MLTLSLLLSALQWIKAIPASKSGRPEIQPVSDETLVVIKEKCRLRRKYSQAHDPLVKTRINQWQKKIKDNLRMESQANWEKFCNEISLESNHTESWRKIENFLKPKGLRDYLALHLDAKTAKTDADKAQLFLNLSKDTLVFGVIDLIRNTSMRSNNL